MMMVDIVTFLLHLHLDLVRVLDVNDLRVLYQLWLSQVPEDVLLELRGVLVVIHDGHGDSEVPVQQLIQLKVLIIFSEWIVQSLGHTEPAKYEEKPDTKSCVLTRQIKSNKPNRS